MIMDVNIFKKWDESYLAVVLTFVVIGLLFLLKFQEDKLMESNTKSIPSDIKLVTYVE